jgi:hypothetical protein
MLLVVDFVTDQEECKEKAGAGRHSGSRGQGSYTQATEYFIKEISSTVIIVVRMRRSFL